MYPANRRVATCVCDVCVFDEVALGLACGHVGAERSCLCSNTVGDRGWPLSDLSHWSVGDDLVRAGVNTGRVLFQRSPPGTVVDLDSGLDGRVPEKVEPFVGSRSAVLEKEYGESGDDPAYRSEEVSGIS